MTKKSRPRPRTSWKIRVLNLLAILLIASVVLFLLINLIVKYSVAGRVVTSEQAAALDADCILVLGAGVWGLDTPSPMLEDRLLEGVALYRAGAAPKLLMSGDHGRVEYDEVNVMKRFALERNVPSSDIFMDHAGFSTYESMYRARDIFLVKKVLIVTQGYHLPRALYDAKALGLDAYGVASDPRAYGGQFLRDLRESLARVKDFFYAIFQPLPTFLGDTIPIGGDGNATND